jgi:hypothetical protein
MQRAGWFGRASHFPLEREVLLMKTETYLGDGLYASFDGFSFNLRDGDGPTFVTG